MATCQEAEPADSDARLLVDTDLAILLLRPHEVETVRPELAEGLRQARPERK